VRFSVCSRHASPYFLWDSGGDAENERVENAGVEIAGVKIAGEGKVWKAKVLKCVSDYILTYIDSDFNSDSRLRKFSTPDCNCDSGC